MAFSTFCEKQRTLPEYLFITFLLLHNPGFMIQNQLIQKWKSQSNNVTYIPWSESFAIKSCKHISSHRSSISLPAVTYYQQNTLHSFAQQRKLIKTINTMMNQNLLLQSRLQRELSLVVCLYFQFHYLYHSSPIMYYLAG